MKILLTLFVLLFSSSVVAVEYILTCFSDKEFVKVYSVDENSMSIVHLSSKDLINDQEWNNINMPHEIIYWNNKEVHTFNISSAGIPTFITFDLKNYNFVSTGHYVDNPDWEHGYAFNQYFKCVKG